MRSGFTTIELLAVVLIVALLSAAAAPFFLQIQSDARAQNIGQVESSMRLAAEMIYAKAVAANKAGLRNSNLVVNQKTIRIRYGYPDGRDMRDFLLTLDNKAFTTAANTQLLRVRHRNAARPARCQVRYLRPNRADQQPRLLVDVRQC